MTQDNEVDFSSLSHDPNFLNQVAIEKLGYMHSFAKSSTVATILAPLLCIPLYGPTAEAWRIYVWFVLMALVVTVRIFLVNSINLEKDIALNFKKLNVGIGIVTLVWGMGWLLLVPEMEAVDYLLYQIISLTVLFVGMVGYCVNWRTFCAFVIPLKVPEVLFICIFYQLIVWPIAVGSMVAFYLALKMALLFSKSWERSMALRFRNDALVRDLIKEKDASNAANLSKSEFIATASHDLRQPMQAINIFMEMLHKENFNQPSNLIIQKLRFSVNLLNKMFDTLLDISKLDANAIKVVEKQFDSSSLVSELQENFYPIAREKNIALVFSPTPWIVEGDKSLLNQLLRNLLSNAIQYTQTGSVEVELKQDLDRLTVVVKDTGMGIPAQDIPLIHNEFYRSEHSRNLHDGLGLGLSIVKRILTIIHGSLTVASELGRGSVFTVYTPFKVLPVLSKTRTLQQRELSVVSEDKAAKCASKHIAIIENDLLLMDAYENFFTHAGFVVHAIPIAEDEFHAYLLTAPQLDFILSDFRLSSGNSLHLIQKIREEFNADIPAVLLTADTSPQNLKLFNELNIQVLYKPIEANEVLKFIVEFFD